MRKFILTVISLMTIALFLSGAAVQAQTAVFINELHYDNSGSDVGEGVEIAGPAGSDLNGWSVVLYNGSNGLAYATISLSGSIPDQGSGFGTLAFFQSGIQNGAPDGLALVNSGAIVVQFLSYEGSFTANDGPANGMTSTDIGVTESSATPAGNSLQLGGSGEFYEDFAWNPDAPNTFGSVNTGQTFVGGGGNIPPSVSSTTPANGAIGVAVDANVEIGFSEDVSVSGSWYEIVGSSSGAHTAAVSGGPQNYVLNPDTDFDGGETVTVTVFASQVVDNDGANMDNDFVFSFSTELPPSNIIINEILADPPPDIAGDANGDGIRNGSEDEFVEIVNNTGAPLDISGWTLSDAVAVRHVFPANTVIQDQCSVVLFGGGTPTGSFGNSVVQTASSGFIGLNNGGDTVTLNDGVVDVVSYTYGAEGGNNQSLTRDPDITGADPLVEHSTATGSGGALFSPGTMIDGTPFAGCALPDNTAPSCNILNIDPGPPMSVDVEVQDAESGLAQINVVQAKNATVNIPAFTVGTNDPVIVHAEKINQSKRASVVLEVIDVAGNSILCDPVYKTISSVAPEGFNLLQNYPNPFNPTTTIHFDVAGEGATEVSIKVYDMTGREVKTLINELMQPGQYSVEWDGTNERGEIVAGGIYFYRITAGSFIRTRKMTLLK